ncbi:hypothetical protein [Leucobacter chromiireducens]|uniref:hypothetical protein n=1 Tax=Leucobacter chromiireducens TaxID=283877 RepID=UPI000F6314E1|nr:hypothetical protein [Leucobacter chromiireducens]
MQKKTPREPRESSLASGWTVEGEPAAPSETPAPVREAGELQAPAEAAVADAVVAEAAVAEPQRDQVSNGSLVALGVFGGLYLLYTLGWANVAQAYATVNALTAAGSGSLGGILQQIVFWAAPFAPAMWFFAALVFARGKSAARLTILLAVGAVVLLPLPMLIARGG